MTLEEILNTPSEELLEIYIDWECWIYELNFPFDSDYEDEIENEGRIKWREHLCECSDGRRGRWIRSCWLDGKPVMLTVASGRDGTEYTERYVVDQEQFNNLIQYLVKWCGRDEASPLSLEINELYYRPLVPEDFVKKT